MDRRTGIIVIISIGLVLIWLLATAIFAWRTSAEILDDFHRVNSVLDSARVSNDRISASTLVQFEDPACRELAGEADSLHRAYQSLSQTLQAWKDDLGMLAADNTTASDSLFDADTRGVRLHATLVAYYDLAGSICTNDSMDQRITDLARPFVEGESVDTWRSHDFFHMPVAANMAILSKYRSDAATVEAMVMNDLLTRCTARAGGR